MLLLASSICSLFKWRQFEAAQDELCDSTLIYSTTLQFSFQRSHLRAVST